MLQGMVDDFVFYVPALEGASAPHKDYILHEALSQNRSSKCEGFRTSDLRPQVLSTLLGQVEIGI